MFNLIKNFFFKPKFNSIEESDICAESPLNEKIIENLKNGPRVQIKYIEDDEDV